MRLIKRLDGPPDGYRYTVPETGYTTPPSFDVDTWMVSIRNYYRMNNIPIPENIQELAEDQLCRLLPPGWCRYSEGGEPQDFIDTRLGVDDVLRGTATMIEIGARRMASMLVPSWTPFVDQATAEARAATCASCYVKVPIQGCLSCREFTQAVSVFIGERKTQADPSLETHACAICKCSARAHVHVRAEILARNVDDATYNRFQTISHCWKAKALRELRLTPEEEQSSPAQ